MITRERFLANGLTLLIEYNWLGQDQSPSSDALSWSVTTDYVAVSVSVRGFDADGEVVHVRRWWPPTEVVGLTLSTATTANGLFRAALAATAESSARGAVSALLNWIEAGKDTRLAREEERRQAEAAAGVPSWVRETERSTRERP